MNISFFPRFTARRMAAGLSFTLMALGAQADDLRLPSVPKAYASECAACHIAYPAPLLTPTAWQKILANLGRHFGTDAAVEPQALKSISAYVLGNAATNEQRFGPAPDRKADELPRLTRTAWFERKHQNRLPDEVWRNPKVRSAANCEACHQQASRGSFSEREIAVPGYAGRDW